jgi:hypothetical protein
LDKSFPEGLLDKNKVVNLGERIEIHLEEGVLILFSNKQWEWIENYNKRTLAGP